MATTKSKSSKSSKSSKLTKVQRKSKPKVSKVSKLLKKCRSQLKSAKLFSSSLSKKKSRSPKKRALTSYQKFVRDNIAKMKHMKPTDRMKAVGAAWRRSSKR